MSAPINDGGPAFPYAAVSEVTGQPINGCFNPGMTLRDYFAAAALTGTLSNPQLGSSVTHLSGAELATAVAEASFAYADAMLKQREGLSE